ncbi:MAG: hypothetical protein SO135_05190 [Sphaerochaetaceae bacterium]|nr:hypothetical protein [Sphaerochaetaceae bacterium]NLY06701.1 hypothetical protein [Spirochaetales bacterium]
MTDRNEIDKDELFHVNLHHEAFKKGQKEFEKQRLAAMKTSLPKQRVSVQHHEHIMQQSRKGQ